MRNRFKKTLLGVLSAGIAMNAADAHGAGAFYELSKDGALSPSAKSTWGSGVGHRVKAGKDFVEKHEMLTFGAKILAGIAATSALTTFGIPVWLASPLVVHATALAQALGKKSKGEVASEVSDFGKDVGTFFLANRLHTNVMQATKLWAPKVLESTVGKFGVSAVAPLLALSMSKTLVSASLARAKTAASYAKENPLKAAIAVTTAGLATYYGAPLIKEALFRMGETSLSSTKALIDHGSGAIKASVVTYNPFTNGIIKEVEVGKHAVSLSETMVTHANGSMALDKETMRQGVDAVKDLVERVKEKGVSLVNLTGAATAWARSEATNIQDYIDRVRQETGVTLNVLTQVDEGQFGRIAAAAKGVDVSKEVVLDTGGGSLQLTQGQTVYGTETASATFASHVEQRTGQKLGNIEWSKDLFKDLLEEAKSKTLASNTAGTGQNVLAALKKNVEQSGGGVKGIGNVYNGVLKFVKSLTTATTRLTSEHLDTAMSKLAGKTTAQIAVLVEEAGLPKALAGNVAANLPLVGGVMKAFDLGFIDVVDTNSGAGVYFYDPLWQDKASNFTVSGVEQLVNTVSKVHRGKEVAKS